MGKPQLCFQSYLFRKDKKQESARGIQYWRCLACKARVRVCGDDIVGEAPMHTHAPVGLEQNVKGVKRKIREAAAAAPSETPSNIVSSVVADIASSALLGALPSMELCKQTVRRERRRQQLPLPPNPVHRRDLVVPVHLRSTRKGDNFLLWDSGPENDRILVFGTDANLQILKATREWHLDGTFKVCPDIFEQLYTVHAKAPSGKTVPVLFALLPGKSRAVYHRLLEWIGNQLEDVTPEVIHIDFEMAMLQELTASFPGSRIVGCNFHFEQALWRKVQDFGEVRARYREDDDFAFNIRMLAALAFVPVAEVVSSFEMLLNEEFFVTNYDLLEGLIAYFEDTWIGRPRGAGERRAPRFSLSLWNVYDVTIEGVGRTNNKVEGFHRGFKVSLGATHPTMYKLVEKLRVEQGKTEFIVENTLAHGCPASKRVYMDRDARLLRQAQSFPNMDRMQYMRAVAHNIRF